MSADVCQKWYDKCVQANEAYMAADAIVRSLEGPHADTPLSRTVDVTSIHYTSEDAPSFNNLDEARAAKDRAKEALMSALQDLEMCYEDNEVPEHKRVRPPPVF